MTANTTEQLAAVVRSLDAAMDMQEKRESEEFHISQPAAKSIWDDARKAAREALAQYESERAAGEADVYAYRWRKPGDAWQYVNSPNREAFHAVVKDLNECGFEVEKTGWIDMSATAQLKRMFDEAFRDDEASPTPPAIAPAVVGDPQTIATAREFFDRHALPYKAAASLSCFGCGAAWTSWDGCTQHLQLPNVYMCADCARKIASPAQSAAQKKVTCEQPMKFDVLKAAMVDAIYALRAAELSSSKARGDRRAKYRKSRKELEAMLDLVSSCYPDCAMPTSPALPTVGAVVAHRARNCSGLGHTPWVDGAPSNVMLAFHKNRGNSIELAYSAPANARAGDVPAAYLHIVVQDDGFEDQALSFSPDSFPFEGIGGFKSISHEPLYRESTTTVMREALLLARNTFEGYAALHREKGTADGAAKAALNIDLATRMNAALAHPVAAQDSPAPSAALPGTLPVVHINEHDEYACVHCGCHFACDHCGANLPSRGEIVSAQVSDEMVAVESAWKFGTPDVKEGDYNFFIVTVERKGGKRYSFPAAYLNAMVLENPHMDDDQVVTGWYDIKWHSDYDEFFESLLSEGDAVIAWQSLPPPCLASLSPSQDEGVRS